MPDLPEIQIVDGPVEPPKSSRGKSKYGSVFEKLEQIGKDQHIRLKYSTVDEAQGAYMGVRNYAKRHGLDSSVALYLRGTAVIVAHKTTE